MARKLLANFALTETQQAEVARRSYFENYEEFSQWAEE